MSKPTENQKKKIDRALKQLLAKGKIEIVSGKGRNAFYRVVEPKSEIVALSA